MKTSFRNPEFGGLHSKTCGTKHKFQIIPNRSYIHIPRAIDLKHDVMFSYLVERDLQHSKRLVPQKNVEWALYASMWPTRQSLQRFCSLSLSVMSSICTYRGSIHTCTHAQTNFRYPFGGAYFGNHQRQLAGNNYHQQQLATIGSKSNKQTTN
jgi:hypothetical protein